MSVATPDVEAATLLFELVEDVFEDTLEAASCSCVCGPTGCGPGCECGVPPLVVTGP